MSGFNPFTKAKVPNFKISVCVRLFLKNKFLIDGGQFLTGPMMSKISYHKVTMSLLSGLYSFSSKAIMNESHIEKFRKLHNILLHNRG